MGYLVSIPQDITAKGKDYLRERGYTVKVGEGLPSGRIDPALVKREIADADAVLVRGAAYNADVLAAAPKLKVVGRFGVGVDNIDVDYCTRRGIWVVNAPLSNALSVAEHTIGFLVAVAHHFSRMDRTMRTGDWEVRNRRQGIDLDGKILGLVGLGRIGRMVAEKARAAFNMEIVAHDPFLPADKFPAGIAPATLADVFAKADFVSLHMPATPATNRMVNATLLGRMKPGAFLVNCARGEVVDEAALYDALKNNRIAGAAIDVFSPEPAKADNPLLSLDNIIVTPHSAALTDESMDRMGLHAAMGIHAVLSGGTPEWAVNRPEKRKN